MSVMDKLINAMKFNDDPLMPMQTTARKMMKWKKWKVLLHPDQ